MFREEDIDGDVLKLLQEATTGRAKLKILFENYPNVELYPDILANIAGIRDWTRTIRYIREEDSMDIEWVETIKPKGYYILNK
jgi:hypothetical protein